MPASIGKQDTSKNLKKRAHHPRRQLYHQGSAIIGICRIRLHPQFHSLKLAAVFEKRSAEPKKVNDGWVKQERSSTFFGNGRMKTGAGVMRRNNPFVHIGIGKGQGRLKKHAAAHSSS